MKFKFALLILFLCISMASQGQVLWVLIFGEKMSTDNFQVGMNPGLSLSTMNGYHGLDIRSSFYFGSYFEFRINDEISFQPELNIFCPAGAKSQPDEIFPNQLADSLFQDYFIERRINYISLPLFFKYRYKFASFGLGPQINLLSNSNDYVSGTTHSGLELTLKEDTKDLFMPLDFGMGFLLEFYLNQQQKMRSSRIGFRYYYGFRNMMKSPDAKKLTNTYLAMVFSMPIVGKDK